MRIEKPLFGSRFSNRSFGTRSWAAVMVSIMMVVPMVLLIGMFASTPAQAAGPATVDLKTAGDYAIFALTGIDTTPGASTITGDIGVGPGVTSTAITGFALSHVVATAYATTPQVVGKVYAFDYANPTPANVTQTKADVEAAYLDASGRPAGVGPFLDIGAGTVTGQTLVPGTYTWTTAINIPTDITFSGGPTDTWILQIAGTLTMAGAMNVNLIGGAVPQNIFWQVSGAVTIGAGTHFEGILLGATSVTMGAGASIDGRLLAQTAVNLNACAVTEPDDAPPASVSSVDPIAPYWGNDTPMDVTADCNVSCDSVELYYRFADDNSTWGNWTTFGNDTSSPWLWSFTFTNGTGHYEFYTQAWNDTAGREAAPLTADARCGYEIAAPASAVNAISPYWSTHQPTTITANATDAMSGVCNVTLYYRYASNNVTFGAYALFGTDSAAPWSWAFTFPSGAGYYQFYTRAFDNASNQETAPGVCDALTGYDNILPVSSVNPISPYLASISPTMIGATAIDASGSGMRNVTLFFRHSDDNATWGAWTEFAADETAPYSYSFNWPSGIGYYEFYSIAIDNAGNVEIAPAVNDTSAMYDFTPPTILTSAPMDGSVYIPTDSGTFAIHFSKAMNATAGIVETNLPNDSWNWSADKTWYNGTYDALQYSTDYYVNLTGFEDSVGNDLAGDMNLTFTTRLEGASGPAPVDLGTATDFIVLAKAGVSTTGTSLITGDIGISPISHTAFTGFSETMDASGEFATSPYVVGRLYAADYSPPTPAKMTTAISDMETAYTTAAGRTLPDYTELYAGDVTGQTLSPGLYKWSSGLLISAGGVTIAGKANDTWIFQIAQDLTVANGAIVYLSGGAQPSNIVWQVAGQTVLGTTSAMKGVILCKTQIVIRTGATLAGNALAQTAVTIDANTVDLTPPTVSLTTPANLATGVVRNTALTATFSEPMNPLTINTLTFTLKQGATPVSGTVTYSGVTAIFTPASDLAAGTTYTATITTGVTDVAGNAMEDDYVWTFTTGAAADTTAPTVSSTIPANNAVGVANNSAMSATFSEAMDPLTINNVTFTLKQGATPVSGVVTYVHFTATFTPSANLSSSTIYTATITTGAKDLAGNALAANKVWTFTTGAEADTTAPTVSFTVPVNAANGVAINSAMSAIFSEAMAPLTLTTTTFTLKQGITPVSGTVSYTGFTATFTPLANLASSTVYTATITTGAKDLAGNALAASKIWTFTTGAVADTTPPTVSFTVPVNAATGVAINSAMSAVFSEAMAPLTLTTTTFTLKQGITAVSGAVTYVGFTATFTPLANLASSTVYTATITTDATDLAGNALAANKVWTFTTGAVADTTAPTVSYTVPANAAVGIVTNSAMSATFSEAMDPLTINTVTFTLKQGTTAISGAVTYVGFTATFTPLANLATSTVYTATITTGATDLAGNALAVNKVWMFTTGAMTDTTAPTVSFTVPVNAATGVVINSAMSATFSEAMDPLTINPVTFTLKQGTTSIPGAVTYSGFTAILIPVSSLSSSTVYTATITTGAKDLAGNALAVNKVWTFTTGAVADTTAPTVTSTVPADGATEVANNTAITATFSEAMDPLTITTTTFTLWQGTTQISGSVTYSGLTAVFAPTSFNPPPDHDSPFANIGIPWDPIGNTTYTATITSGAKDLAGNALAEDKIWTFTTGTGADTTAPSVTYTVPANGAILVVVNTAITATFSEAMDPLTITALTFTLMQGTTSIPGAVTYAGFTAIFTPLSVLASNTVYTANITTDAEDLAGNNLAADKVWRFTTGSNHDVIPPTVSFTVPLNMATGVFINSAMTATFSEAMDPLTINTVTFTLEQGPTAIPGAVTYVGFTATFTPLANLTSLTTYTATITTGAKDLAGHSIVVNKVWTFTTGLFIDAIPPTVSFTVPVNAATGVFINSAMSATFSEAMDPLTINTVTFTLKQGTTAVSGVVTNVHFTATFTPLANLASSTVYTATITTGAKDLAGNSLAVNKVWTFTTGVATDTTAPTVSLTVPLNAATGVAINSAMSATFSEAMDPLTINTVTFTLKQGTTAVSGAVTYVGFTATFTPLANLTSSTVYTATITTGVRDLAGNAKEVDKVWTFTTGPAADATPPTVSFTVPVNSATGVVINSAMSAIFSEAMNPLTINAATFTLRQGTTAVPGAVTYVGFTATFTPLANLASSTIFTATITTGATDLAGNALAVNKVWAFTTGTIVDTTPPVVTHTINADGATNVPVNTKVAATFSEAMDPLTINAVTFTLKHGTTAVAGDVTYVGFTATFTPDSVLASSTVYTATITTGAKDLAGNAMANDYAWSFTTGATPDTDLPTVTDTINSDGATNVPINTKVGATFSEAMDPLSITTLTFTLTQEEATPHPDAGFAVDGTVTYSGVNALFIPDGNLIPNTLYTVEIKGGVGGARDLAGNYMAVDFVISWTTGTTPDTTAPMVIDTINADGATNVAVNTKVGATFSEAMDPLTITAVTFTLEQGATPVPGTVTYTGVSAVLTPAGGLLANTTYTATITNDVKDLAGNAMTNDYVWSFSTGAALDTTSPHVTITIPADDATNVPTNIIIRATFSEAMDPLTITTATFTVKQGATPVPGTVTYAGLTAVFRPMSLLAGNLSHTATITTAASDLADNAMTANHIWTFTTSTAFDITAPIADAGINQTATVGDTVTFDGSASTDDVYITNYTWTFDDGASQTLHGVAPAHVFAIVGVYNVTLTVEDSLGNTDSDTVAITIIPANTAPTANAGPDQTVNEDVLVTLTGAGSADPEGDTMTYSWAFTDGVAQTLAGVGPTYTFATPGIYTITLTASDGIFADTDTVVITVLDVTDPTAVAVGDIETVKAGGDVVFTSTASDNVGVVSYLWTIEDEDGNEIANYTTSAATHTFEDAGVYTVTLTVTDAAGNEGTDTLTTTVTGDDDDDGSLCWLWVLIIIIIIVIVAVIVAMMMMGKKKEGGEDAPKEASKETPEDSFPDESLGEAPESPPLE